MARYPDAIVMAVEEALPTTWSVGTSETRHGPSMIATSPDGRWKMVVGPNANAPEGGYNVELHKTGDGVYQAATVRTGDTAAQMAADFIEEAVGIYRGRRHEMGRSGSVDDSAGLFDDLGF
jgi:hypothetical protein